MYSSKAVSIFPPLSTKAITKGPERGKGLHYSSVNKVCPLLKSLVIVGCLKKLNKQSAVL